MLTIQYTLLADGSSDATLKPIIDWVIGQHRPDLGVLGVFATSLGDVGMALESRVTAALRLYPCDVLIIHRDAEGERPVVRLGEMERAMGGHTVPWVPLIPVRMTEAWLLSDEIAIRSAAENKRSRVVLNLPPKHRWEQERDPKSILFEALEVASEKSARALRKFYPARQRALVAQHTGDFSALRGLPSFDFFEAHLVNFLRNF